MAKQPNVRVEWMQIVGDDGVFLFIAEWTGMKWEFWKRESWEVRWYEIPSRTDLIKKAEALLNSRATHIIKTALEHVVVA